MQSNYLAKVIMLKEKGLIQCLKNCILFDGVTNAEEKEKAEQLGVRVLTLDEVMETGRSSSVVLEPEKMEPDDCIMLFYTSGTTGDSKGAKATNRSILSSAILGQMQLPLEEHDTYISYLPSPHAFVSWIFNSALVGGTKIGYYSGDPTKLTEDC